MYDTVDSDSNHSMAGDTLDESVVLLTGGTAGIGRVAGCRLAGRGATVAVVGRDQERGRELEREVNSNPKVPGEIRFHRADLGRQVAVCELAEEVVRTYDRLDVLAHNAGLSRPERTTTPDGIETTLAVNHLAPYLLTHELLDRLRASSRARIVVTASGIHRRGTLEFDDLQFEREYDCLDAYARSKLANVAFTIELAERLENDRGITVNCFHPGFVPSTDLFRNATLRTRIAMRVMAAVPGIGTTPEEGADRLVRIATSSEFGERSGVYVGNNGIEPPSERARDPEGRQHLWRVSANLVDVDPDWP